MQLRAEKSLSDDNDSKITVSVPPTRSDVLHPCDVMEVFLVPAYFSDVFICIKYVMTFILVFSLTRHFYC